MAAKTKINDHGDVIFTEQEAIDLLYTNPDFNITKLFFDDPVQYNNAIEEIGLTLPKLNTPPARKSLQTKG